MGRPTLGPLIDRLKFEAGPFDEIIIIADGRQLSARGLAADPDPRIHYLELAGGYAGCPQRDAGMAVAKNDFLMFADDDDNYIPGAISRIVRPALALNPKSPHLFRIPAVALTDPTSRHMPPPGATFVPPNNHKKLSFWTRPELNRGALCDWHFINETLKFYSAPPIIVNRCIYLIQPGTTWMASQIMYRGIGYLETNGYMDLALAGRYDRLNELLDQFDKELDDEKKAAIQIAAAHETRQSLRNRL